MDIQDPLLNRLAQLRQERDALQREAEKRLSYLNGQIELLEELTQPPAPESFPGTPDEPIAEDMVQADEN